MTQQDLTTAVKKKGLSRFIHLGKKLGNGVMAVGQGFYVVYRHQLYKQPNNPENTRYVQWFCRRLCDVFNIEVRIEGEPAGHEPALWVSNHISWLDIPALGSGARVFFWQKLKLNNGQLLENWRKAGELYLLNGVQGIPYGFVNKLQIF